MITLSNGIQLDKKYMIQPAGPQGGDDDNPYRIKKVDLAPVFNGTDDDVRVPCACLICEGSNNPNKWDVSRKLKAIYTLAVSGLIPGMLPLYGDG